MKKRWRFVSFFFVSFLVSLILVFNSFGDVTFPDCFVDGDCSDTDCSGSIPSCDAGGCGQYIYGTFPNVPNTCENEFCTTNPCVVDCEDDLDEDGYSVSCGDADDENQDVNPGANEICDGLDNEGDGLTDADDPDLIFLQCPFQTGVCAGSLKTCFEGSWLDCTIENYGENYEIVETTINDNLDNDCDGSVDEGGVCSENGDTKACGFGIGICVEGTQTCTDSIWGDCIGSTSPIPEICDNSQDDDCDGLIDENCQCDSLVDPPQTCSTDTGTCTEGTQSCVNDLWSSECTDGVLPIYETCDGSDEDCDGSVDEHFDKHTCEGACTDSLGNYITDSCLDNGETACCDNPTDKVGATGFCIEACCLLDLDPDEGYTVTISPDCGLDNCETDEYIDIEIKTIGYCNFIDYIQVDANDGDCNITHLEVTQDTVDIEGGIGSSPASMSTSSISAYWLIPEIPDICYGDIIHGVGASLYSGGPPGTGTWITGTADPDNIWGLFSFVGVGECGDGTDNVGEDCYTCPNDSGCAEAEICYIDGDSGTCQEYDGTDAGTCNEDDVCDDRESCDCSDCEDEQDGCIAGRYCSTFVDDDGDTDYECACDNSSDGICAINCLDDPDCVGQCGNSKIEGSELCEVYNETWSGCSDGETCTGTDITLTGNLCDCYFGLDNGWILYYTKGDCVAPSGSTTGQQEVKIMVKCIEDAGCEDTSFEFDGKTYNTENGPDIFTKQEECTLPPEKVPFFTTLNILLVAVLLIGYYLKKKN